MKYIIINNDWKINKEYNINKLLYLLIDRPDEISFFDSHVWKNKKKQFHRDYDLPAFVWDNGDTHWCKNSKMYKITKLTKVYSHSAPAQ